VTGVVIIERVKCVYDEIKITDMCTSPKAVCRILKNQQLKEVLRWNTSLICCIAQV
jgi:hypothetical protein